MAKICMTFGVLSLYRKAIYTLIDKEYDCDWYTDDRPTNLKKFDDNELKNVTQLHYIQLGPFFWIKGQIGLLRKNYDVYFALGSTRNVSLFLMLFIKKLFFRYKKIYLWTHGLYGKESKIEWWFWKRPMLKMADGLFTYGDYAKNLLVERCFDEKKIYPIHNSLDYDIQLELRNKLKPGNIYKNHFGNENPVLIFIGRLTPVKRLDMLLDAVCSLKNKEHMFNVVFVGDGSEKDALLKQAEGKSIDDQVWFYGACYDEKENAELVYNADICIAPGNIGLTAMHSLMFGCPAISHNNFSMQMPEFEAIIPDVTGDFYQYGSVKNLSETIETWYEKHKDEREKVRKACYHVIDTGWNPYYQMEVIKRNLL